MANFGLKESNCQTASNMNDFKLRIRSGDGGNGCRPDVQEPEDEHEERHSR